MAEPAPRRRPWLEEAGAARRRLRGRLLAIVQTATAAAVAWYLAVLILPQPRPAFAAIAAVIAVGATNGQRIGRAVQLVGGVVLGLLVADLLIQLIGTGGWQLGVLIVVAMSAAVLIRGGELLVVEAGVSAILLVALDPGMADGFEPSRIFEGVIGGLTALAISSLFFPPDPALAAGRAVQAVFDVLGRELLRLADALERADAPAAERALEGARGIDELLRAVEAELAAGRDTARFAPPRRRSRSQFDRYARSLPQVDFAVRNSRVLARHVVRMTREGQKVGPALPGALRDLATAVWELAAAYDSPSHAHEARWMAVKAASEALDGTSGSTEELLVGAQLRSVAVDLVRAAERVGGDTAPVDEQPTEELLLSAG